MPFFAREWWQSRCSYLSFDWGNWSWCWAWCRSRRRNPPKRNTPALRTLCWTSLWWLGRVTFTGIVSVLFKSLVHFLLSKKIIWQSLCNVKTAALKTHLSALCGVQLETEIFPLSVYCCVVCAGENMLPGPAAPLHSEKSERPCKNPRVVEPATEKHSLGFSSGLLFLLPALPLLLCVVLPLNTHT